MLSKFWNKIKSNQQSIFMAVCIVLISLTSYNIGQINSRGKLPIKISADNNVYKASAVSAVSQTGESKTKLTPAIRNPRVVVSKSSSSKKYHYSWCSSAGKIKEENKIWFASAAEAESKGYTLAGNCTQ